MLDLIMVLAFKGVMKKNTLVAAAFAGDRVLNAGRSLASLLPFGKQTTKPTPGAAPPIAQDSGGF